VDEPEVVDGLIRRVERLQAVNAWWRGVALAACLICLLSGSVFVGVLFFGMSLRLPMNRPATQVVAFTKTARPPVGFTTAVKQAVPRLTTAPALPPGPAGITPPTERQVVPTPAGPPLRIDVVQLVEHFRTNEAFAERNYTNKAVEVTGRVVRIIRFGRPLPGGGSAAYALYLKATPTGEGDLPAAFYFPAQDQEALAKLVPGAAVTVTGTCGGKEVFSGKSPAGHPEERWQIWFHGCKLLPTTPDPPQRPGEKSQPAESP
jgi:hypothetical protein